MAVKREGAPQEEARELKDRIYRGRHCRKKELCYERLIMGESNQRPEGGRVWWKWKLRKWPKASDKAARVYYGEEENVKLWKLKFHS